MNHRRTCDDKCLIYPLTCECCSQKYVGETTRKFRFRCSKYKCHDRKYTRNEDCLQDYLFRHFHSEEHTAFFENVKITLTDKTNSQDPKKSGNYWRRTIKTYFLSGLM